MKVRGLAQRPFKMPACHLLMLNDLKLGHVQEVAGVSWIRTKDIASSAGCPAP